VRRKIIDMHQHLGGADAVELAETYARLGVERAVLLGMPPRRVPNDNEQVLAAARKYPKLFVPFVGFDLDEMGPADLARFHDAGFTGIKFIGPAKAYNDPAYLPVYEKAADLRMIALFHLGIVANTGPWHDCDSGLMRPIHLDHIARKIPELTVIGAHLGNPWSDEAAMACRWNPNLFFDLSGSLLKYRSPEHLRALLWWTPESAYKSPDRSDAWQKILFGSDVAADQISDVIQDYEKLMDGIKLRPELREAVWYDTAARLLGLK
jgi:uncharacterized protein